MTKLPDAVIKAAFGSQMDRFGDRDAEDRARRVILALAENLPESMVEKALNTTTDDFTEGVQYILIRGLSAMGVAQPSSASWEIMRAAIIAALKDLGGDSE